MRLIVPEEYKQYFSDAQNVVTHRKPYVLFSPGFYDDPF